MSAELSEKTERLLRFCSSEKLGGVLINSQPNFAWLTAGGRNGVDSSRENGVATLFVRSDGKRYVLANNIEIDRIRTEELKEKEFEPIEFGWEEEKADPQIVHRLARSLLTDELPIACDLAIGDARVWEGLIARLRFRLTAGEMDRFRALGQEAGEAVGDVAASLVPGFTEREVARRVKDALATIDADAVVTLVAADDRLERFRHPLPKDVRWKRVLMIVVCARRYGLVASLTRLVCSGPVPEDLRTRTHAAARVNAQLFAATKPGTTGAELYEVAANAYREVGFPGQQHLHHQGGAAGYRTRDWVAHPGSAEVVEAQQAFAWNPSITGTKVEETIIAFENGIELITTTPGWPSIPIEIEGTTYRLPDVLSI
jgi:Xaa-Pro aminopeptidase